MNLPSKIATAIALLTPRHLRHRPGTAMAKLTNGKMKSPRTVCKALSHKRAKGGQRRRCSPH